jgi:hypothetical protein
MQQQLLLKILQVLCLGTAIHGLELLPIDSAAAETATPTATKPIVLLKSNLTPTAPAVAPVAPAAPSQPIAEGRPINAQIEANPVPPPPPAPPNLSAPGNKVATTVKILAPTPNNVLDIPATVVVIQYRSDTTIELKVDGRLVDKNLIGRTETDSKTNLITQTWYGVPLSPGKNILTATSGQGEVATATIQVAGAPTKIQLGTAETRIPADGRTLATIEGQLLDENGNTSKQDHLVTLSATAGEFAGIDADKDQPGFQVQVQKGKFTAKLRAGLDAQTVRIRAANLNMEAFAQVQFETNLRSSIATGVVDLRFGARGTDYYRPFTDFLPTDRNNSSQLQARGQVFATGRLGDWAATGAFNSDRSLNRVCNNGDRLSRDTYSSQSCEDLYPLYGDTSKVDVLTPSRDSVFAKLERSTGVAGSIPDMVMWGDYGTNEFASRSQQFTATNRNLHGAKANYNIGNAQVSGFYGDNVQGFQRDNIAPDGTSGHYFLSQRLLLGGSENISIEIEELNRPGTVVKQEILNRGLDYDIDYDRGTVILRKPLLRTLVNDDGTILVRRLVATYQFANGSSNSIYGARGQYNISRTAGQESWLGASWTQENLGIRKFEIFGVDALVPISPTSSITAEYARSTNNTGVGTNVSGNAIRVDGQYKFSDATTGRSYFRTTEAGFSNNSTTSFVPGQTRYGVDLSTKLSDRTTIRAQFDREENRGKPPLVNTNVADLLTPRDPATGLVDNDLRTITVGLQQRIGITNLDLDYVNRSRQDRLALTPGQSDVSSSQIRSRFNWPLANNLTLRAQNEINLSNQQDQVYPNRSGVGIDWAVYPGIKLGLNQNFMSSTQYGDTSYTSLDFDSSYNLTQSTKVTGRYSLSPFQSIGSIGAQQGFVLSPGLKLDLNYERVIGGNTSTTTGAGQQFNQPYSSGQTGSSLNVSNGDSYGIGINYTDNPNFQANARYEFRNSGIVSSTSLSAGITGKLSPALSALLRFQQSSAANQVLRDSTGLGATTNLKAGLAFRNPNSDEFNGLLSYQYRKNPSVLPTSILTNSGTGSEDHTLALEGIYAPDWRWEFGGKYALRNATSYLDQSLTAGNTLGITQLRATYRLAHDWDVTGDVRWINQFSSGRSEMGAALEAGYYLTPDLRLSAGYSLGAADDPNGNRNASGAYLGLTVKINELFGGFGRQQLTPPQQQESKVAAPNTPAPATIKPVTPVPSAPTPATVPPVTPVPSAPAPATIPPVTPAPVQTPTQPQTLAPAKESLAQ